MKFLHRIISLSLYGLILTSLLFPAQAASAEQAAYYKEPDPVTDLYLRQNAGFDEFLADAGEWRALYPNGDRDLDPLVFLCNWQRDEFEAAMARGESEFTVRGEYLPPALESGYWDTETYARWDAGFLQIDLSSPMEVTVHVRPGDLVAVYGPDPEMPIQTIWIDGDSPPLFSELYLLPHAYLLQTDSPFEPSTRMFEVSWDEASYWEGLAGGADRFAVTGTFGKPYPELEGWEQELYDQGLILTEGREVTMIQIRNPERQVYENPYSSRFGYTNFYQFQIYIRPDTDVTEVIFPAAGQLSPDYDSWDEPRTFGLIWDREEYEKGIASGEDTFTVSGAYASNPDWPEEDKTRWESGKIRIAEGTPQPELTVRVLREDLPFTVKIQNYGGLVPTFTFPWPNGAEEVEWSFSFDKETWFRGTIAWAPEWEWKEAYDIGVAYDEEDQLITIPESRFYCKLSVTGSAFAGETAVMKVTPDDDGKWTMDEDQGGDHGGGGQGEHLRPGKEEPVIVPEDIPPIASEPAAEKEIDGAAVQSEVAEAVLTVPAEEEDALIPADRDDSLSAGREPSGKPSRVMPETAPEKPVEDEAQSGRFADEQPKAASDAQPDFQGYEECEEATSADAVCFSEEAQGGGPDGMERTPLYASAAAATAALALLGAEIARFLNFKKME